MAAKRITPRNKSERALRNWSVDTPDFYLQDELFRNFEKRFKNRKYYDYYDVARHGRRIFTIMFHDLDIPVEEDSAVDDFITAVAAQAATSAFAAVGEALGVTADSIEEAVYEFYGGAGGPALSADEFLNRAKDCMNTGLTVEAQKQLKERGNDEVMNNGELE